MNHTTQKPLLRARRKGTTATTTNEVVERKRKARSSTTEDESKSSKRRSSHQPKSKQAMTLESDEVLNNDEIETCDENTKRYLVATLPEKRRRSLRQQALKNNDKLQLSPSRWPVDLSRPRTPTELINGMTSFTFSNYFTPVSLENSPLPQLSWADSNEVWENMLQKDRDYKRDSLYIRKHPSLQPRMRAVLLDWLIEVCEVYRLHRETFYLAVDYVDRYLSTQRNIAKTRLQLIGIASLFVAAKMEEIYPPKLTEFAYVTDGACTEDEILQQEQLLLQALQWKLTPVTPVNWLTSYLQIANKGIYSEKKNTDGEFEFPKFSGVHLCRISELIDLCCLDTGYLQFSYSIIAASALYHMWGKDVTDITGHKIDELFPCIQWLSPFSKTIHTQAIKSIKSFDKIPTEDAHNIQVHNNGVQLLDYVHSQMNSVVPLNNLRGISSMVQCKGLLTPPRSTEKEFVPI